MSDIIIIILLSILVMENSRYGIRLMDWLVLQLAHMRHARNKAIRRLLGKR